MRGRGIELGEEVNQPPRDAWPEQCLAIPDRVDGAQDFGLVSPFEKIAARTRAHGGKDRVVIFEHGQYNHPDMWVGLVDKPCGFNPVHARHLYIHQDYIWLEFGSR